MELLVEENTFGGGDMIKDFFNDRNNGIKTLKCSRMSEISREHNVRYNTDNVEITIIVKT